MDLRTEEIRNRLKEERIRQGLSVNKVYTMATEAGYFTSQTTAKRIFSDDPGGIKYETLQPYVTVLFGTNEPTEERKPGDEEQAEEFRTQLDNMKQVISLKNAQIESQEKEITSLRDQVAYLKTRVDDVKELFYTGRKTDHDTIKIQRKYIGVLFTITFILVVFIICVLVYDLTHLDRGWFQTISTFFSHKANTTGIML